MDKIYFKFINFLIYFKLTRSFYRMTDENSKVAKQKWSNFELPQSLTDSLKANSFSHPTEVQARSLVHL